MQTNGRHLEAKSQTKCGRKDRQKYSSKQIKNQVQLFLLSLGKVLRITGFSYALFQGTSRAAVPPLTERDLRNFRSWWGCPILSHYLGNMTRSELEYIALHLRLSERVGCTVLWMKVWCVQIVFCLEYTGHWCCLQVSQKLLILKTILSIWHTISGS